MYIHFISASLEFGRHLLFMGEPFIFCLEPHGKHAHDFTLISVLVSDLFNTCNTVGKQVPFI